MLSGLGALSLRENPLCLCTSKAAQRIIICPSIFCQMRPFAYRRFFPQLWAWCDRVKGLKHLAHDAKGCKDVVERVLAGASLAPELVSLAWESQPGLAWQAAPRSSAPCQQPASHLQQGTQCVKVSMCTCAGNPTFVLPVSEPQQNHCMLIPGAPLDELQRSKYSARNLR